MLLAFLLIQGTAPVAVDVTGMPPQIAYVRHTAAARGWRITCEGRSGEEQVLRLETNGATSEAIEVALDNRVSSGYHYYSRREAPGTSCDHEPPSRSGESVSALAFGADVQLTRLLGIARSCGFSNARIREVRAGDGPPVMLRQVPRGALVLSAEEDIVTRDGPSICFLQMQYPPGANLPRRPAPSSRQTPP